MIVVIKSHMIVKYTLMAFNNKKKQTHLPYEI